MYQVFYFSNGKSFRNKMSSDDESDSACNGMHLLQLEEINSLDPYRDDPEAERLDAENTCETPLMSHEGQFVFKPMKV